VLANILNEIIQLASTVILDWLVFAFLGHPIEGWEATYLELWRNIVLGGFNLDNIYILVSQFVSQLIIDWSELLAVS
jgi:hypothetical protein